MRPANICRDALRPSAKSGSRYAAAAPVSYHQPLFDVVAGRSGAQSPAPHEMLMHQIRVKNTFVDVVDESENPHSGPQRSASDSDISRDARSEDDLRFWAPSLTFSSSDHSSDSGQDSTEGTVGAQSTAERFADSAAQTPLASSRARHNQPGWFEDPEQPSVSKVSTRPEPERGFAMEPEETSASQQYRQALPIVQQLHEETELPVDVLMDLHTAHDLSLVPRDLSTNMLLSVGSIKHNSANCNPCMFIASGHCYKGMSCVFCHFTHHDFKPKRYRPPKKKRDKMKAAANRPEPLQDADSCGDEEENPETASSSSTAPIGHLEATFPIANQDLRLGQCVRRMMDEKPNTKIRL